MDDAETIASIIQPYFDAVRDTFAEFAPAGRSLSKAASVKFVVEPEAHDTERHFARMRTDGLLMQLAPEIVDLPALTLVSLVSHEFGHALDFLYPGCWTWPRGEPGETVWVGDDVAARAQAWRMILGRRGARSRVATDDSAPASNWMRAWGDRSEDEVEWAADAIVHAVTGQRIGYCGKCMLQCLGSGASRPAGLR